MQRGFRRDLVAVLELLRVSRSSDMVRFSRYPNRGTASLLCNAGMTSSGWPVDLTVFPVAASLAASNQAIRPYWLLQFRFHGTETPGLEPVLVLEMLPIAN